MSSASRRIVLLVVVLITGLAVQIALGLRQWVRGDQYGLLEPAIEWIETGELSPVTKPMSGGGRIPGGLLQLLVGVPLSLGPDYRAPGLAMGLSHLLAVAVLLGVMVSVRGWRLAAVYACVYWLSPWRLYHAGFLWEPGFLFLPAALHLGCSYRLRACPRGEPPRWEVVSWSLVLGAILTATLQIHASFVLLGIATLLLWACRQIRPSPTAFVVGLGLGAITLLPTARAWWEGTLPDIPPSIDTRMPLAVMAVSNAFKSLLYWFRLGSLDIGRRLRQTVWLESSQPAPEPLLSVPESLVGAVVVLTIASAVVGFVASFWYFRDLVPGRDEAGNQGRQGPPGPGTPLRERWLRRYALTWLGAVVLGATVSPVPVQGWHVLVGFHAACIPVGFWFDAVLERHGLWPRSLLAAFAVLAVLTALLLGAGHPTYLRPRDPGPWEELPEPIRPYARFPG